jgi:hypothetical protein
MSIVLESAGIPVAQYDGVAEWEAETLEEILEIFVSDEYEQVGNPVLSTDHAIPTQNTETCP